MPSCWPRWPPASGSPGWRCRATSPSVLLLPADGRWLVVDTASDGVHIEPLAATDFSRPLARVVLDSGANPRAGRGAGRDRAGGRGRRDHPLVAADRRRLRQGPRAVRQADRQLPGDKTPLRRNAVPRRAGRSGRRRRRPRGRRGRPGPVLPRGGPGRGHRHHRGQGQRQGLHPGARRHRLHLGTRRPPVPAPCPRHRPLPGRGGTLAAPYHRAHPGGRAPPAGYRPDRGRGPAAPDHRGRRPHRRAPPRAAARLAGRRRTGAAPRRPSSC